MTDSSGMIFDIQKFSIHDGPGIRTTVFLKGCPLDCLWCHNPESKDHAPEIAFDPARCIGCRACALACPEGGHTLDAAGHRYDRSLCRRCGTCAAACHAGALERIGREMTVAAVLEEVLKDRPFYETSGGGMTLSGGEPLLQPGFTRDLLAAAAAHGLHTCVETCGFAAWSDLQAILPLTGLFLYDCKETDPARHLACTGVASDPILDNLRRLDQAGAKLILRCPIIPGLNDRPDHLEGIARLANGLQHLLEINLMPYHPLGASKSARIGVAYPLENKAFAEKERTEAWLAQVQRLVRIPVRCD